jgi:hypothetical protein
MTHVLIIALGAGSATIMGHSCLNYMVSDPWWPKVETKVSHWGGDDHTINEYPLRGGGSCEVL